MKKIKIVNLKTYILVVFAFSSIQVRAVEADQMQKVFEVKVKKFENFKSMMNQNEWFKKLYPSNLYKGLTYRLSSALFSLGTDNEKKWDGRLIDFLMNTVVAARPVNINYYKLPAGTLYRTNSTIGLMIGDLTSAEKGILSNLITYFISSSYTPDKVGEIAVNAIDVKGNKFAVALKDDWFYISKSDHVIKQMLNEKKASKAEAELEVVGNVFHLAPHIQPFMDKFFGVGSEVKVSFNWDNKNKRYLVDRAIIPLHRDILNSQINDHASVLSAIPAENFFFSMITIPAPQKWEISTLEKYFRLPPLQLKELPKVNVTLVHLGMNTEVKKWLPLSALIIPFENPTDEELMALEKLFGYTDYHEVSYRKICGKFVVLSNSPLALEKVVSTCEGRTASVLKYSSSTVSQLKDKNSDFLFSFRLGDYLAKYFKAKLENEFGSREVQETFTLLEEIPNFTFSGMVVENNLVLKGSQE